MINRHFCFRFSVSVLALALLAAQSQADVVIVNDSFADEDRAKTGPLDADWWSSNSTGGNSVEIDGTGLGLVTGSSGRGIHATFAPQTLGVGDNITITYSFTTPATVGTGRGGAFKVALMDFDDPGLAADLSSSSSEANPIYVGQPGYMSDFDVNTGSEADVSIRKHDTSSALGRFLGTTSEWNSLGSSSDAGYTFGANTDYVGVYRVTRTGDSSVELFSSLSQGSTLLDSFTDVDDTGTAIANNFGMFGIWANSNTFGTSNSIGDADNGITFTNVLITTSVPEPGSTAFLLSGLISLGFIRRRK